MTDFVIRITINLTQFIWLFAFRISEVTWATHIVSVGQSVNLSVYRSQITVVLYFIHLLKLNLVYRL